MKNKYKNITKDDLEEIKKGKFKEIQDILDSNSDDKNTSIDKLYREIEDIEKEIDDLKTKLYNHNNEYPNKYENSECNSEKSNFKNINEDNIRIEKNNFENKLDIEKMEIELNEYIKLIKDELDFIINNNNNDLYKYKIIKLKMDLNKISSDILLFKYNFIDYFEIHNK